MFIFTGIDIATPGDTLLKVFKLIEVKSKISEQDRIKFVSKSGTKLSDLVKTKDPFSSLCTILTNKPCVEGMSSNFTSCRKMNINYEAKCNPCDLQGKRRVYIGESTRNIHVRSNEHFNALKNMSENSWMYKHIEREHSGKMEEADFDFKVIKTFKKPMLRQLSEAVNIQNTKDEECLNLKNEYFSHKTRRYEVMREQKKYQCRYCGREFSEYAELNSHIKMFHERLKCGKCKYISFGKRDFENHQLSNHNDIQPENNYA